MKPLISVIVPVYKVEKYLRKCVDSILSQTYVNLEIILVDDGSPDGCGAICDDYARRDRRVRVIHKQNGGLSSARNAGIDVCRGEYISFIDSDDFVSPCFIEALYSGIAECGADISSVQGGVWFTDENEADVCLTTDAGECRVEPIEPREAVRRLLYYSLPVGSQWRLYSRAIFSELRFPEGMLFEDHATTHRTFMLAKSMALVLTDGIYAYRVRPGSIMHSPFSEEKLVCTVIGTQIVADVDRYDNSLHAAACSRAFALNYHVFIEIPADDRASLQKVWGSMLRYRGEVIRDKSWDVRLKDKAGALCTYLGRWPAYRIGRIYEAMKEKKQRCAMTLNAEQG